MVNKYFRLGLAEGAYSGMCNFIWMINLVMALKADDLLLIVLHVAAAALFYGMPKISEYL